MYGLPEELANLVHPLSMAYIGIYIGGVNRPVLECTVAFSVHTLQELTFLAK